MKKTLKNIIATSAFTLATAGCNQPIMDSGQVNLYGRFRNYDAEVTAKSDSTKVVKLSRQPYGGTVHQIYGYDLDGNGDFEDIDLGGLTPDLGLDVVTKNPDKFTIYANSDSLRTLYKEATSPNTTFKRIPLRRR